MIPDTQTESPIEITTSSTSAKFPQFDNALLNFPIVVAANAHSNSEAYSRLCQCIENIDKDMLSFDDKFAQLRKRDYKNSNTEVKFILLSTSNCLARIEFSYDLYFRSDIDFQNQCVVTADFLDFLQRVVNNYSCRKNITVKSNTKRVRIAVNS